MWHIDTLLLTFILGEDAELTDKHLLEISKRIKSETELRTLAVALKVERHCVSGKLTNFDITVASYHVLENWFNKRCDGKDAYKRMCKALKVAGMKYCINEVLKKK